MSHVYYISYKIYNNRKLVKSGQCLRTSRVMLFEPDVKQEISIMYTTDVEAYTRIAVVDMFKLSGIGQSKGWNYVFD
jgi:hypothetical protein